ncbi:contractile injection system tape measure protein, partial [Aquiflexum sp.]|uniref:contractile injection system tape measure protein n=1 Tax=Aquiflexum sp. TaxID=1872584 RepID=UPI00359316D6
HFELKQIFLAFLKLDDSIIIESILKPSPAYQLIHSFKTLLDLSNIEVFLNYIDRYFEGFSNAFKEFPAEKLNFSTKKITSLDYPFDLLAALIFSKGDQNSPYFLFFQTKANWEILVRDFKNYIPGEAEYTKHLQRYLKSQLKNITMGRRQERRLVDIYWYKEIWNMRIFTASSNEIKSRLKNKKLYFYLPRNTTLAIPPKSRWIFESLKQRGLNASVFDDDLILFSNLDKKIPWDSDFKFEILRFWFEKGYLPWWSHVKKMNELVLSLDEKEIRLDKDKLEVLRLLFADEENMIKLENQISPKYHAQIKSKLTKVLGKKYFRSDFLKDKKSDHRDISDSNFEKHFDKIQLKDWLEKYSRDKNLLEKTVYYHEDGVLTQKFFGENIKIKEQVEDLLEFAPYIYFGNLTGSKWRRMVYEFAIQYPSKSNSFDPEKFHGSFLLFIQRKYALFNWDRIFNSLQKEITKRKLQIKLPIVIKKNYKLDAIQQQVQKKTEIITTGQKVIINNSGLVLTWPFLTMLFSRLGMLEGNRFIDEKTQNRAVYLLQHLAFGDIDFPEYDLVLNKILVGMPSPTHLEPRIVLTDDEKNLSESLLKGMLQNWGKLNTSTAEALQVTFLQREGELVFEDSQIILNVENKGVDALMDFISWNINMVKLPWMEKPIIINWRK